MARVIANAAVSLDGFVARPTDDPGPLFDFYENGSVEFFGDPERVFHVTQPSADYMGSIWSRVRASIIGRHLFDITDGWRGRPAVGDHVFVVTHTPPTDWRWAAGAPFTFVTDGLESAVAQARSFAGEEFVAFTAGDLLGQALRLGLIDELSLQLVPVVLGNGVRFFGDYAGPEILFDNPRVVEGDRVTHLHYVLTA